VLRARGREVVQFDGPVLELLTESRTRFDRRLAMLGPDILAPELDEGGIVRRLRADDPTRGIGDALLDQRTVAGIGNLWKCEGCFGARVDPWRRTRDVGDDEVREILRFTRPRMQASAADGMQDRHRVVYGAAGRPCPRCGTIVRRRGQGDDNRPTYWCPGCQR
jgi:endonuclease VIII